MPADTPAEIQLSVEIAILGKLDKLVQIDDQLRIIAETIGPMGRAKAMIKARCELCTYWASRDRECRRFAPGPNGMSQTGPQHFCGEFAHLHHDDPRMSKHRAG